MIILNDYFPPSTNEILSFFSTISSTLIGAFSGALLAFIFQHILRKNDIRRSNIEGLNTILITLSGSLNILGHLTFTYNKNHPLLGFSSVLRLEFSGRIPAEKTAFLLNSSLTEEQKNIILELDMINHQLNHIRDLYVRTSEIVEKEYRPEILKGNMIGVDTDPLPVRAKQIKTMIDGLAKDMPTTFQEAYATKEKLIGILKTELKKKEYKRLANFKID